MQVESTLGCIVCGSELKSALPDTVAFRNQPDAGTSFSTPGHYGSTAFDPMDGHRLEINVCDRCLVSAAELGRVILHGPASERQQIWDGKAQGIPPTDEFITLPRMEME